MPHGIICTVVQRTYLALGSIGLRTTLSDAPSALVMSPALHYKYRDTLSGLFITCLVTSPTAMAGTFHPFHPHRRRK